MTDIQPGDKVTLENGGPSSPTWDVIAVHPNCAWIWIDGERGGRISFASYYRKVEPFFEPGKTYQSKTLPTSSYQVERVDTDSDGERVAYGMYAYTSESTGHVKYWVTIRDFRPGWKETDDE